MIGGVLPAVDVVAFDNFPLSSRATTRIMLSHTTTTSDVTMISYTTTTTRIIMRVVVVVYAYIVGACSRMLQHPHTYDHAMSYHMMHMMRV